MGLVRNKIIPRETGWFVSISINIEKFVSKRKNLKFNALDYFFSQ